MSEPKQSQESIDREICDWLEEAISRCGDQDKSFMNHTGEGVLRMIQKRLIELTGCRED
jgi:hypothetical protein